MSLLNFATTGKTVIVDRGHLDTLLALVRSGDKPGNVDKEVLDHLETMTGVKQAREDLKIVHAYLHHNGANCGLLSKEQHGEAMSLCDGYGKKTVRELDDTGLMYDWSHVRDSSPEALAECRAYIQNVLP